MRVQLLKCFGLKKKNIYKNHKDSQEWSEQDNINFESGESIKSKNKRWSIRHKLRNLKCFTRWKQLNHQLVMNSSYPIQQ